MVFSGIVEAMGRVVTLRTADDLVLWDGARGAGVVLTVEAPDAEYLARVGLGDSIAVNGTCLTVTALEGTTFQVGLAPETLRRTNLGDLTPGDSVNLERSLPADGRNSGHFVQGHVDDTGRILEFRPDGDSLWVRIAVPPALIPFIVPKGYIAVDGTSLTVCEVHDGGSADASWFNLMLIAHTQRHIVLPRKAIGSRVNIEVDVMGKYAARAMAGVTAAMEATTASLTALVARVEGLERRLAAIESASSGVAAVSGSAAGAGAR